jgi:hypothetical protein
MWKCLLSECCWDVAYVCCIQSKMLQSFCCPILFTAEIFCNHFCDSHLTFMACTMGLCIRRLWKYAVEMKHKANSSPTDYWESDLPASSLSNWGGIPRKEIAFSCDILRLESFRIAFHKYFILSFRILASLKVWLLQHRNNLPVITLSNNHKSIYDAAEVKTEKFIILFSCFKMWSWVEWHLSF